METTKNKLTEYQSNFFNKLGNYLDTKIYFYGSIQRNDYFPKSSDIDVDVFTDSIESTIIKLQHFLQLERTEFSKIVYRLHKTNQVVYGYKVKYKDITNNFKTEISIYNEKDKESVLIEHNFKTKLPFYISFFLVILKNLYYNFGILPKNIYIYIKKIIMDTLLEGEDSEFITLN